MAHASRGLAAAVRGSRALALLVLLPLPAAAQSDPEPYRLEYSSIPMTRNAALIDAGLRLAERGTDGLGEEITGGLFARPTTAGRLARLGRWLALDLFVVWYGTAFAHEYGHVTRAEEAGQSAEVIIGAPWWGPSPMFRSFYAKGGRPTVRDSLSLWGGGLEGADVLADRVFDRAWARGQATPWELTLLILNALDREGYILRTLSEGNLADVDRFFGHEFGASGDPAHYAVSLTAARLSRPLFPPAEERLFFAQIQPNGRAVRDASLVNFVDYGLAAQTFGLLRDYLWRGEHQTPMRSIRLGAVSVVPSLSYHLSPVGPERQVRSRYRIGAGVGHAYVRWTPPLEPGTAGTLGMGGTYRHTTPRPLVPKVSLDLWRNANRSGGLRGEVAASLKRGSHGLELSAALGAKSEGYLPGYPLRSGAYFNLGAGLRF